MACSRLLWVDDIHGIYRSAVWSVSQMKVLHGCSDVAVPHKLLYGHDIGMDGQQVRRKGVSKRVQAYIGFGNGGTFNGLFHNPACGVLT